MKHPGFFVTIAALTYLLVGCTRAVPPSSGSPAAPTDPPKAASPQPPSLGWGSQVVNGVPYYLMPIPQDAGRPRRIAAEELAGLFKGMAEDRDTRDLLRRLHGGARVDFLVMEGADEATARKAASERPPVEGRAVCWVITSYPSLLIDKADDKFAPGISQCLQVFLGWTCLTKLNAESVLENHEIMVLVCNDYLLRHRSGYQLRHGDFPPGALSEYRPEERPPEKLRAELDKEIGEVVKRRDALLGTGPR